jgi:hypothetical protein
VNGYRYTVDEAVLHAFATVRKKHRERLLGIFDQLLANPFLKGDTVQADHTGRQCQVKRFGEWTVTWWPEHLANEIHVLAVEHLRV